MTEKTYDNHTLYIVSGQATEQQIYDAFRQMVFEYQKKTGLPVQSKWKVNVPINKEGKPIGLAYVFVTDPAMYHMILGRNPDGSERIQYIDNPAYVKGDDNINDYGWANMDLSQFETLPSIIPPGMSWAEFDEWETQREKEEIKPKIEIKLEPLMSLPPFKMTSQQMIDERNKIIEKEKVKPGFDPALLQISDTAYFKVYPAAVKHVEYKYMSNVLKADKVPSFVTPEILKSQFTPFASDHRTKYERSVKGQIIQEAYPFVSIDNNRTAFVVFDPKTTDAQFALHMMKRTVIKDPKSNQTAVLYFGHSNRTGRDAMVDLVQQPPRPVGSIPTQQSNPKSYRQNRNQQNRSRNSRN